MVWSDPFGLAALTALVLVAIVAFYDAVPKLRRARAAGSIARSRAYHVVNAVSVLLLIAWAIALVFGIDRPMLALGSNGHTVVATIGVALAWAAAVLAVLARVQLGGAFVPTASASAELPVVTRGVYTLVRHPFYAGVWLCLTGLALAANSALTAGLVVVLVPALHVLAREEERHLVDVHGEAYRRYQRSVRRWGPL